MNLQRKNGALAKQPPDAAASHHHEQNRQCDCSCKRCNHCCERKDVHNAILKCEKHAFPCAAKMGASASYPSLEDCPCVPNSRWPWGSVAHASCVALSACGRACSRPRPGGAGSGRGCWQRSWITNLIPNARMRPQPPLLTGASVRRSSASCPGAWQEALSLPNLRAEHPLVAWPTSGDLFICAKDLFIAAMDGKSPSRLTGRGKLSRAERHQSSAQSAQLHHAGPNAS